MSKEINITLKNKTQTFLGGREIGKNYYNEYLKDKIDLNNDNKYILIFPEQVDAIAISFVKGFIENIVKEISINDFYNFFEIEGNEDAVNDFKEGVEF